MSRETARYTYTAGSRPEGVIVYDDDAKLHSHHDTDPARGQHSAFDLVRLHRFGHLDKESGDLPITERPSHRAMVEFASALPEIRGERVKEELVDLGPMPETTQIAASVRYAIKLHQIRSDILTATLPPPQYLWAPRIPRDGVTLLIGEDGLGKSWLALQLSLCAAAGRPLFGVSVGCGRSIYVHAEDRRPMIERRVQTILRSWNDPVAAALAIKNFNHHDTIDSGMLLLDCSTREVKFTPWVYTLRDQLGAAGLTTFDPVARLHNGDEKDNTLTTQLVAAGETIAQGTKGAIVMPHHPTKQGTREHTIDGTETRGGGGLRAAARSQLRLIAANRKDLPNATNVTDEDLAQQNVLILHQPKLNDGAKAPPLILKRMADGMIEPFCVERGDPLQGLVAWFKSENKDKPFTATRARNQRRQWGVMAERGAEEFIAQQVKVGALVPAGTASGHPAYVISPATLERIADLDAQIISTLEGWDDIT